MSGRISILLADDHVLFRQGLRELLSHESDFAVVAECATGEEAVRLAERHAPDVVLLDVEMPGQNVVQTVQQLSRVAPDSRIVVLTMHDDASLVNEVLGHGSSAFLTKTVGREELIHVIRSVSRGGSGVLLSVSRETFAQINSQAARQGPLTARELDVLRLLAQACSNAQIAGELYISEATVKRHLTNIYAKLAAVSRVDAIRKATALRLI
jgi:DNA-binding NarL/FixJ family response regulator